MRVVQFYPRIDYPRFERFIPQIEEISKVVDDYIIFYMYSDYDEIPLDNEVWKVSRRSIKRDLKMIKPDIYYGLTRTEKTDWFHYYCSKNVCKSVLRFRGNRYNIRKYWRNSIHNIFWNLLDNYTLNGIDRVVPIRESWKKLLENKGFKNIGNVVYNGIDLKYFKFMDLPEKYVVGFNGRLEKEKGSDIFFKVVEMLPHIEFLYAGKNDERLSRFNNVKNLGFVPHKRMMDFYKDVTVVLMPSRDEGVSNTFLETLATGRIPLITKVVNPFNDLKCLSNGLDVYDWCNDIMLLRDFWGNYKNRKLYRKYVEKFTWDNYSKGLLNEFNSVLNG